MNAHVALERIRQIGAERRMRGLIGDELRFAREGKPPVVVPAAEIVGRLEADRAPLLGDELIGREELTGHRAKAAPLVLAESIGPERLERAVEHRRGAGLRPGA